LLPRENLVSHGPVWPGQETKREIGRVLKAGGMPKEVISPDFTTTATRAVAGMDGKNLSGSFFFQLSLSSETKRVHI